MSLIDQADRLLMDNKAPVITEAMQSTAARELNSSMDALAATALRIRDERDQMAAALNEIILGSTMHLDSGLWSGAALAYIKAVKQVAEAGLREGSVSS